MGAGRNIRMGALAAAGGVFALAGGAALLLVRLDRTRASERMASDAQAAGLRAADGVRTLVGSLEVQVQNGTANPRLVAALDANVDQETLRDLLLTEPWWEPFRRAVDGYGLYSDETTAVVTSRLPVGFDARALVHEARGAHHTSSGLVEAAGQVMAVASSPVALTGRSDWPVLVATKVLDVGRLSGMAERAGASVAISDGRRLLVAATTGASGGADGLTALKQAIDLPAPGVGSAGGATVAALPLSNGLRILVGVAAPTNGPSGMPLPPTALAILGIGLVFGIAIFVLLTRKMPEETPVDREGTAVAALTAIGRYTLIDRIGQGGMAEIYSAVTTGEGSFRRPVVIKRLRPELAVDPNAVAQFCDEANLLSAFHHPNIVAVHDFGRWQNQFFLAEEYVPGRDLGALVTRRFNREALPPPPEFVAYVAYEILEALDYAHTLQSDQGRPLGIVHRDISPENVMVSLRGDVKLLDFGVGKAAEGRVTKTDIGVVKGNVTYMSPEQARGLEVDSRADLYSLGLVMFGCCAGRPLYAGDTTYSLLMKAGVGPGPDERAVIDQLPRPFGAVVQRATAARIEDRYASAREMASDLEPWARQGAAGAGALVTELYGPELRDEAHRMATFVVDAPTATAANLSLR
ncbi:MAG TPA: serine/threonine-protein kinase [Polyangia bacterium]|nr:serine/threonine-protein kinase [Polyangia bacterium]